MNFEPEWKLPSQEPRIDIATAIVNEALRLVAEQLPDLAELFPFRNSFHVRVRFGVGWCGLILQFSRSPGIPSIDELKHGESEMLENAASSDLTGTHAALRIRTPIDLFSFEKFAYVGPYQDHKMSWPHLAFHIVGWINDILLPEVLRHNEARVLRAIPRPPQIDFDRIGRALWVLECEADTRQGSAFMLKTVGLVTCEHVLGRRSKAFRPGDFHDKRAVNVVMKEEAVDLAVLELEGRHDGELEYESADLLKPMDHLVICGFPNYRVGDTGTMVPGLVVGFRTVSGVRRILTNAPIIAGASGAPVLNANGKVIGVAVTGTDRMEAAQDTEHHSIVPIDAIKLLRRSD